MKNLIETLTEQEKRAIKYVELAKDQILFFEGDLCECIGIVIQGELNIISYAYNGNEIVFNHLLPYMMFGNNLLFSSEPYYKGSVIAKKTAKIALIYKKDVIYLLKNNQNFLIDFLHYQSDFSKELNNKIKLLSMDSAEERFMFFLQSNGGKINFQSITDLAGKLSLQRETLSRLISKLIKRNIIYKKNNTIFLNNID